MPSAEAVIVGGGVVGASILHALALGGMSQALLLEQGAFGSGATRRSGAMVRCYHSDSFLSDCALESLSVYRTFEEHYGEPCGYVETGSLYFDAASRRAAIATECARLERAGARLELLDAAGGSARFPGVAWSEEDLAVHEPASGYADPVRTTEAMVRAAVRLGARAEGSVRVEAIEVEAGRVAGVRTAAGLLRTPRVILAAGPWSQSLLAPLGIDLGLYNKVIQTARLTGAESTFQHPCFFDIRTRSFGRSSGENDSLVGVASQRREIGPALGLSLDPAEARQARALAIARLPALAERSVAGGIRAVDCYSPDRRGVLGPSPALPGLFLAVGWSGTGFKMAPALGRRAALAILDGREAGHE